MNNLNVIFVNFYTKVPPLNNENKMIRKLLFSLLTVSILSGALLSQQIYPKREFRGAWVATVANIDWPSSRNASSGEQIAELVSIFDKLQQAGINAVMFQIRTECDAFYDSPFEPWSYWLTGKQGKAPSPYYDPLEFAVAEAHKRGMELHAWFNPYRAVKTIGDYPAADNHVFKQHPEWLLQFSNYKMLDPGQPAVKDYVLKIVTDVISRYDIDGIHFDDYFYPYGPKVSNEDSLTYAKYNGGIKNIDDWRRFNINDLMAKIYGIVKSVKPYVKFGISPFGIVENKYANTNGFNSYSILYCDPLTWLNDKTVDYVNPQLYWEIGHNAADFAKLLPWWATVTNGRHLYIGHFSSRMAAKDYKGRKSELGDQLRMNRATRNVDGEVFFSAKSITMNMSGFADSLKLWYKYPALPPVMAWKDSIAPLAPGNVSVTADSQGVLIKWDKPENASDGEAPARYIVYCFDKKDKIDLNDPSYILTVTTNDNTIYRDITPKKKKTDYTYIVTALDRLYNESAPSETVTVSPVVVTKAK